MNSERELDILEAIHNRRHIKQRDLAHILGISVGMTNAIIRRLAQKGLLTIRKVNNRNIRYAVSPDGMEALAKRSVRYLKSTIRNVVDSKQAVEELVVAIKRLGYEELDLVGSSALDFVVEHVCSKYGLDYRQLKTLPTEGSPGRNADNDEPTAETSSPAGKPALEAGAKKAPNSSAPDGSQPVAGSRSHAYFLFSENYQEPLDHNRECHGYLRTILSSKTAVVDPAEEGALGPLFAGHPASVESTAGINR